MRALLLALVGLGAAGCLPAPYEAEPTSPAQWQRRQEAIERRETDRQAHCRTMNRESPDYESRCTARPGDPD